MLGACGGPFDGEGPDANPGDASHASDDAMDRKAVDAAAEPDGPNDRIEPLDRTEPIDRSVSIQDGGDASQDGGDASNDHVGRETSDQRDGGADADIDVRDSREDTSSSPDQSDASDAGREDISVRSDSSDVSSPDGSDAPEEADAGVADTSAESDSASADAASDGGNADVLDGNADVLDGSNSNTDVAMDVVRTCDASPDAHPPDLVDQENRATYPDNWIYFGLYMTQRDGQTFTVGHPGILSGIDTRIYRNYQPNPADGITLQLFRCTAADACDTTQAIASVTVPAATLPDINAVVTAPARTAGYFDLSCYALPVQANQIYLFVLTANLSAPAGNEFGVIGTKNNSYPGGLRWFGNFPWNPPVPTQDDGDLSFVTYETR